jgi:hypothetical protein
MADTTTRAVMDEYLQALLDGSDFGKFFAPDVVWTIMETGEEVPGRDAVVTSSWQSTGRPVMPSPSWSTC